MEFKCSICGRKLKSFKSIRRGAGAICEKKLIEKLNEGQVRMEDITKECSNLKYQER